LPDFSLISCTRPDTGILWRRFLRGFSEHGAPQAKYPPISHADGHQYYAVDARTKGVLDTMATQVSAGGSQRGRARDAG
tara:strand:+ start:2039 stop:2275 length:237 start_codon:yes stop_codon:yes gene_type:complete